MVLGLIQQEVVVHGLDLSGGGVLAGQAVTAGKNFRPVLVVDVSGADVLVQRLADGADLLHAVQHSDLLHGLGHGRQQVLLGERAEQVYLQEAHLLAPVVQVLHGLLDAAGDGAHGHDDALGIGCAIIIK